MRDDFETDAAYRTQLMKELIEIIGELGWSVALPAVDDEEEVPGMIIGVPEYIEDVLDSIDGPIES